MSNPVRMSLALAMAVAGLSAHQPAWAQSVDQKLGKVHFATSCNADAQVHFDKAMLYQHSLTANSDTALRIEASISIRKMAGYYLANFEILSVTAETAVACASVRVTLSKQASRFRQTTPGSLPSHSSTV